MRNLVEFGGYELPSRLVRFTGHRGFTGMNEGSVRTALQMTRSVRDSRDISSAAATNIRYGSGGGSFKI